MPRAIHTIRSGGDTTLDGAVVKGDTVKADVGGNLLIRSEQDTSTGTADEGGGGFDASICYFWCVGTPVVAGGSVSRADGNGRYASVAVAAQTAWSMERLSTRRLRSSCCRVLQAAAQQRARVSRAKEEQGRIRGIGIRRAGSGWGDRRRWPCRLCAAWSS